MQKFTDFALQLVLPPNPVANLDGSLTQDQAEGEDLFLNHSSDDLGSCSACHVLDAGQGFFGTDGSQSDEGEPQRFKVAHLRNQYQKVGMFGMPFVGSFTGDQVRGFGFLHDGSFDTLFHFMTIASFTLTTDQSRAIEQFLLAFPSDLAAVVGQQVSIGPGSPDSCGSSSCGFCGGGASTCLDVGARINTLHARAAAPFDSFTLGGTVTECDLVARTVEAGAPRGYARQADGSFLPDDGGPGISASTLRAKAGGAGALDLHYLCAPPGSGMRMGVDRDEDAVLNGLDNCPAWPNGAALGTCIAGDVERLGLRCSSPADCGGGGYCSQAQEDADADGVGDACEPAFLPEPTGSLSLLLAAALLGRLRRRRAPQAVQAASAIPWSL